MLTAVFSSATPSVTDWLNVRLPRSGVTGQNCSGVNRPCETAPGKRVWMKALLMSVTYSGSGSGLLVPPIINAVIGLSAASCAIAGSPPAPLDPLGLNGARPNSVRIGALIVSSACDTRAALAASACA